MQEKNEIKERDGTQRRAIALLRPSYVHACTMEEMQERKTENKITM